MATYLVLNAAVLIAVLAIVVAGRRRLAMRPLAATVAVLVLLTVIFDNVIIAHGIVAYDLARISGIYIGKAPIEDFAYSIVAALLVPYIWRRLKANR